MDESFGYFVRDRGSRVFHHWDYARDRADRGLCGHAYSEKIVAEGADRPRAVCRACQSLAPPFEVAWWRTRAEALDVELAAALGEVEDLTHKNRHLTRRLTELEIELGRLRRQLKKRSDKPAQTKEQQKRKPATKSSYRQPPRIRVVSGGAPGLGKRR